MFLFRYLVLSLQTCPCSNLSVIKTGAVRSHSQLHMYLVFPLSLHQIISRLPVTWLADGATVTRPLQGVVIYLTHLAQELLRGSIGHPDHLRLKTRFGLFLSLYLVMWFISLSLSFCPQGSGEGDIRAAGKTRSHFRIAVSLSLAQPPPSPLSPSRRHNSPLPSLQRHCLYTRSPFLSLHLL